MEGELVVSFISLEFGYGRRSIKYTTFIKIHYGEYFIIGYWAKYRQQQSSTMPRQDHETHESSTQN